MEQRRRAYQIQDSSLTLREALKDYYEANPHLLDSSEHSSEVREFFRSHDLIHVVFGCDTSFVHEARADLWTMMGTDVGIRRYLAVAASPVVRALYQDLKTKLTDEDKVRIRKEVRKGWIQALLAPFSIYRRTRRMKRKWPWMQNDQLLDSPLREIRQEFGIQIF
jgi:ubiquinone biosynthesis protein Coq4